MVTSLIYVDILYPLGENANRKKQYVNQKSYKLNNKFTCKLFLLFNYYKLLPLKKKFQKKIITNTFLDFFMTLCKNAVKVLVYTLFMNCISTLKFLMCVVCFFNLDDG